LGRQIEQHTITNKRKNTLCLIWLPVNNGAHKKKQPKICRRAGRLCIGEEVRPGGARRGGDSINLGAKKVEQKEKLKLIGCIHY
jgi:hypothetical protein